MRAAIYARYSTDRQSETSLADQFRRARDRAAALGLTVAAEHGDDATSASIPVGARPGGKALLAELLGPVTIEQRGEEIWAAASIDAAGLLLAAGGSKMAAVAGGRFLNRKRWRIA